MDPGPVVTWCTFGAGTAFACMLVVLVLQADTVDWATFLALSSIGILGIGLTLCLPILWRLATLATSVLWQVTALQADVQAVRTAAAAWHTAQTALQGSVASLRDETAACHRTAKALRPDLRDLHADVAALPAQLTPPPHLPAPPPEPEPEPVWRCLQPLAALDRRPPATKVADRIQEAITARRLQPGAFLPPDAAIARHLHVSLITVRTAKRRVLDTGAVRPAGRSRYIVCDPPTPAATLPGPDVPANETAPR
jgi:hypothetical protein